MWLSKTGNGNLRMIIAVLALLCSCSTSESIPPVNADPELYPYYEMFMARLAMEQLPIVGTVRSIKWVDSMENNNIGKCITFESIAEPSITEVLGPGKPRLYSFRVIEINRKANPLHLDKLMFHELAHCMLNLCHSRVEGSIMYPSIDSALMPGDAEEMLDRYRSGINYEDCNYE